LGAPYRRYGTVYWIPSEKKEKKIPSAAGHAFLGSQCQPKTRWRHNEAQGQKCHISGKKD
jgi:hypothetical protein